MYGPTPTALILVEAAVLAALNALAPVNNAYWDQAPPDTIDALIAPRTGAARISRVYVAQHQDRGGRQETRIGAAGWSGLVVVRSIGRTLTDANDGLSLVVTAMGALTSPAGHRISAKWDRPIDFAHAEAPYTRGGQWAVTLHRTAAT